MALNSDRFRFVRSSTIYWTIGLGIGSTTNLNSIDSKHREGNEFLGSGGGAAGIVVASDGRCPWFEPRHWQNFSLSCWCNCHRKVENEENEANNGPFKKVALNGEPSTLNQ